MSTPHLTALESAPVRWTPARKEEVLTAMRAGEISRADAIARFALTEDELDSWVERFSRHGREGLAQTRLQVTR